MILAQSNINKFVAGGKSNASKKVYYSISLALRLYTWSFCPAPVQQHTMWLCRHH